MKIVKDKVFIYILGLLLFQTSMYFMVKFTPAEVSLIGNSIDNKIPFISVFVYPYILWYLMLVIVPYLFYRYSEKDFNKYYITTFISVIVVSLIYVFYPTTINRAAIDATTVSGYIVKLIYTVDTPILNCFPSMHCLISFIFIYVSLNTRKMPKWLKLGIIILSILVIVSTLFIKQHVLVDVISAFAISIVIYTIVKFSKYLKDFNVIKH